MNEPRAEVRAPYLGPARRRPLVLDAARAEFAAAGFDGARMDAIAMQAGVSKAVLYDCFPGGKSEIFRATVDRAAVGFVEERERILGTACDDGIDGTVRNELRAFVEFRRADPDGFRLISGGGGTADRAIARHSEGVREHIVRLIASRCPVKLSPRSARTYGRALLALGTELARGPELDRAAILAVGRWFLYGLRGVT